MHTPELVRLVSDITGTSEKLTKAVIDTLFSKIACTVAKGEDVSITGFARFGARACAPRAGRNPRTGEIMLIPPSKKITFHPGKRMKDALR